MSLTLRRKLVEPKAPQGKPTVIVNIRGADGANVTEELRRQLNQEVARSVGIRADMIVGGSIRAERPWAQGGVLSTPTTISATNIQAATITAAQIVENGVVTGLANSEAIPRPQPPAGRMENTSLLGGGFTPMENTSLEPAIAVLTSYSEAAERNFRIFWDEVRPEEAANSQNNACSYRKAVEVLRETQSPKSKWKRAVGFLLQAAGTVAIIAAVANVTIKYL